jgi:hypothetical protein
MTPDYAKEGRVKAICAENGVLADCLDDIALQVRAGRLTEAELLGRIAEWKSDPRHHYFYRGEADDKELFVRAFGESPSLQAKGEVFKKYGAARAAEIAAQFDNTITGLKAGETPDSFKTNGNGGDHSGNPFNKLRNADGTVNKAVEKEIGRMVTVLGKKKCEEIARAAGKTISGLPLRT